MKIIELHAENVKKLKVVDITPQDDVIILSGGNEQGKTSTLDAIQYALDGGKALDGVRRPMRNGSEKAVAQVVLGNNGEPTFKVTRTWTANDKSYLKVESPDGARFASPQAMLNKLIGALAFDPLNFSNMKEQAQLDLLLKLVEIPLDLEAWSKERKELFEERTAVNRRAKELSAQIAGFPNLDDAPDAELSAADLLAEQLRAQEQINENNRRRREMANLRSDVANLEDSRDNAAASIKRLKSELAAAEQILVAVRIDLEVSQQRLIAEQREIEWLQDPDLSQFEQRIKDIEETNGRVRAKRAVETFKATLEQVRNTAEDLNEAISAKDAEKVNALAAAKMPIEGLSFDESGIYYAGTPFNQCSSEERLRVSAAMGMALNPKLRVMFIRDGSLLDTKHREIMRQMASDNDYQLWMEVTDDTGKIGLVFEDGEIVNKE